MESRFPSQDKVRAALVELLRAKGYDPQDHCVEVGLLSTTDGLPVYRVTPAAQAASMLANELGSITGRILEREQPWVLRQGDVNLLFGAVREHASSRDASPC
jgi:hypothetical protein